MSTHGAGRLGVLVAAVLATQALAQPVPTRMSFTANLRDSSGPVTGTHVFVFSLYDAATNGTQAWTETWSSLQVNNGLVTADLGTNTALTTNIFTGATLYLEVMVDGTPLSPRVALTTVPYAARAAVAGRAEALGTLVPSDVQQRVTGTCNTGAIRSIDPTGGVTCATLPTQGIVTITGGGGVTANTVGTTTTLGTDSSIQRRNVAPACTNSYMTGLAADGTASCGNYAQGAGISVSSNTIALASCPNGQVLKSTGSGNYACQDDTAGNVGAGLTGTGSSSSALAVSFAGNGTATSAARSDHRHSFSCTVRQSPPNNGQNGTSNKAAYAICNAGETLTGGFCTFGGGATTQNVTANYLHNCSGCFCIINTPCPPTGYSYSWGCITDLPSGAAANVYSNAICCTVN